MYHRGSQMVGPGGRLCKDTLRSMGQGQRMHSWTSPSTGSCARFRVVQLRALYSMNKTKAVFNTTIPPVCVGAISFAKVDRISRRKLICQQGEKDGRREQ